MPFSKRTKAETKPQSDRGGKKRFGRALTAIGVALAAAVLALAAIFVVKIVDGEKITVVSFDGVPIGLLSDGYGRDDLAETVDGVYGELSSYYGKDIACRTAVTYEELNAALHKSKLTGLLPLDGERVKAALVEADGGIGYAEAVYLGGVHIANVKRASDAENALASLEAQVCGVLLENESILSATAENKLEFEKTLCPTESISDESGIYSLLSGGCADLSEHIAVRGIFDKLASAEKSAEETNAVYESFLEELGENREYEDAYGNIALTHLPEALLRGPARLTGADAETAGGALSAESVLDFFGSTHAAELLVFVADVRIERYETVFFETEKTEREDRYEGYRVVLESGRYGIRRAEYTVTLGAGADSYVETDAEDIFSASNEVEVVGTIKLGTPGEATGSMIWPIETDGMIVTSLYGNFREDLDMVEPHRGIDLIGNKDEPVWAADGGTVVYAGAHPSYGNLVMIEHESGLRSCYAHLSGFVVSEGDKVSKGQIIAYIGMTGTATNYHLHFEIRAGGGTANPLDYLPEIKLAVWGIPRKNA